MRLLEGQVTDEADPELDDLRAEGRELKAALADANRQVLQTRRESAVALSALRKQLNPLYRALQQVFGEMEAVGVQDMNGDTDQPVNARTAQVWANWKSKLGGGPAKTIDALLLHGELTVKQIAIACQCDPRTASNYVVALNRAGIINKNSGRISLKQL